MNELGKKIRNEREKRGWSQGKLGAATGYSGPAIGKIERGETAKPNNLDVFARELGIPLDELEALADRAALAAGKLSKIKAHGNDDRTRGFTPTIVPGRDLVGGRDFPIYAAAMGGSGHTIISFDAIDWVKRPAILENVRDAYGVYIVGDSMEPAFEPGDMALVHPHMPPTRNTDVVLFHEPPIGEVECIIKRLIGFNDMDWTLKQYNPLREFREARASWPHCHRVVGKYSAR